MEIQKLNISEEDRLLLSKFMLEDFPFEIDFNWLMPVVDKCSRLDDKDYSGGMFKVELWMFITNNIGSVCEAVINFIKWQNQPPHPLT